MKEAAEFAESTQILMNVSEFTDVSTATDTLISAVQAFGYTAETSMDVVDLLNTIGNNYAISTADLAQSLTKSSASLVAAGGNLAEAAALTATANAIIQDADSVGTALKTTSLRLRGTSVKVLEEEGLDTDGAVESTSKLRSQVLATSGVDILTDTGAYKSTYQILLEIAEVWDQITDDKARAGLLELLAGKRNSSVIAALLQNPEDLKAAYEDAQNASGSALQENEKYLDSIQGKIDQFNNAVQTLWSNLLNDEWIKKIVEWGTRIVKSLDTVQGKFLAIVKVLAIFMAYKKINPLDWVKNIATFVSSLNPATTKQYILSLLGVAPAMRTMTAETMANTLATAVNDDTKTKAILTSMGLTSSTEMLTIAQRKQALETLIANQSINGLTNAEIGAIAASWGLKTSIDATNGSIKVVDATTKSFMASNPIGWILAIISVVVTLITVLGSLIDTNKKVAETAKEAMNAYTNANSTLREHKNVIEDIKDDYKELADGVDDLGNNISLTTEEYERYNEITNQIADMFPHLISGYTAEGNAILKIKGNVEALTQAYEDEARAARDAVLAESQSVVKDSHNTIKRTGWGDSDGFWSMLGKAAEEGLSLGLANAEASTSQLHLLSEYVNGDISDLNSASFREDINVSRILQTLKKAGADISWWEVTTNDKDALDRVIEENRDIVQSVLNEVDREIQSAATNNRNIIDAYLHNDSTYTGLDSNSKSLINQIVQNLDDEFLISFKNNKELFGWVQEQLVGQFRDLDIDTQKQISLGLELTTKFNNGDISIEEYEAQIQSILALIDALNLENEDEILKSFRIAFNVDDSGKVETSKQNVAKDFLLDEFDVNVSQLTKTDLDIVDKYATEFEEDMTGIGYTWDAFTAKINEKKLIDAFSPQDFEKISDGLDSIQSAYSSLSDAIEQYNNTGYLTLDSLQAILSLEPEYLALLQMENGQLSINQAAAEAMIQAKLAEAEANAIQSAMTQLETLAKEAATKATNDNATAATNAITSLGNYSSALGTVAQDAIVAAGAVSALNNAVDGAKEAGVSEEDVNAVMSNLDTYLSLINTTRQNLSASFVPIVTGGEGGNPEKEHNDDVIGDGWEALLSKYENQLALLSNERDLIQAEIDKAEAQGGKASAKYYEALKKNSEAEKTLLIQKKKALEDYLRANTSSIDQDTWTEYNNEINAIAVAIKECEVNTIEWAEAIREIDLHYFEQINDELGRLGEELEFVNSLLEDEDVADENGNWSSAALTRMGMYTNQMEMAAANAARYQEQIDDLNEEYENGVLSEEQYQERLSDLVSGQQDAISSYEDAKDSIVELNEARIDAIREGIEKEIEAYSDLIDAKKEELDAERDLYDFRKSVQKESKNIAELERRIASLSGSSAASDIAERRKLEAQLMEAKEGLNDTYYDHSRDAQSQALDDENEAYALSKEKYIERLEEQLKDTETLISNSIMDIMLNADTVYNELNTLADTYGITLSEELTQPWKDASAQAIKWKDELKLSMTSGEYAALIGEGGAVTAFANGVATKLQGSWTKAQTAAKDYAGYLTGAELKNRFANTLTGFGSQIQGIIDKWNGVKKAADDAYYAQTRKVTVGGTGGGNTDVGSNGNGDTGAGSKTENPPKKEKTMHASGQLYARTVVPTNMSALRITVGGITYVPVLGTDYYVKTSDAPFGSAPYGTKTYKYYAKGTMGTEHDGWAVTDEFGPELTMYATPEGKLSFMRAGSTVIPADITSNLVEWGKINPDMLNVNGTPNINMITNAINKPELNISFDSLVKAEKITEETLPAVKKLLTQELDRFTRELNYALKGKGAR